jgi:hypothetical protein
MVSLGRARAGTDEIPGFVFLIHIVDVTAALHNNMMSRSYASLPYGRPTPVTLLHWPIAFVIMLAMWVWSKTFVAYFYRLRGRLFQTWVVPRYGFQVLPLSPYYPAAASSVVLFSQACY